MTPPTPPPSPNSSPAPEQPSKAYQPAVVEPRITAKWNASKAFHANPANVVSGQKQPYCILIPPPNVTGALHLGHALNNTLQDVLIRAHRMMGFETLWIVGTDHAGIATQAVVERRLKKEQGKSRKDFTREAFIAKVQEWKDEYEARITGQLKAMGCSCDFDRQRFTMDDICARAVREAFFRLFKDGLIYRGKRLVNWDPVLQTAVADDECYEEDVDSSFYYLRYPVVHVGGPLVPCGSGSTRTPAGDQRATQPVTWDELAARGYPGAEAHPGDQPAYITVATTRPETYLGDTAVAVNPKDHRAKALRGLFVELPLVGRVIPIVEDDYVVLPAAQWADRDAAKADPKAQYATGFLKVTPAHDQNDYELGIRHRLAMVNVFAPDATISDKHGWSDAKEIEGAHVFLHKSREDARKLVIREFEARGLLEKPRPYKHSVKFSDRSKAVIEPYLSDQWYVRVTDDRLAGAANRALVPEQRTGGTALQSRAAVHPIDALDPESPPCLRPAGFVGRDPYPPHADSPASLMTYIRNLPHLRLPDATYFVTWRLGQGSLSASERDAALSALQHWHGKTCQLYMACVMPDHVHVLVRMTGEQTLTEWCESVKKFSSRQINQTRGVNGQLWQDESFDHIVRDAKWFGKFVSYIAHNAVKEGLVGKASEYRWLLMDSALEMALEAAEVTSTNQSTALESRATNSAGDGSMRFYPARYAKTYEQWHDNIRDWCISRQLWWGHRIPVWSAPGRLLRNKGTWRDDLVDAIEHWEEEDRIVVIDPDVSQSRDPNYLDLRTYICVRDPDGRDREFVDFLENALSGGECVKYFGGPVLDSTGAKIERVDFEQDPDVLDTWFSSALWPLSTMGWPEPPPEMVGLLQAFNPTSVLSTAREIITLWVSRMVMMNRYLLPPSPTSDIRHRPSDIAGPVPFHDVFIHAVVQDGEGKKMSKTAGNGVDPLDIIESHGADAMRFTLAQMTTNTQDVRMPVKPDPRTGKNTSEKFDAGRNFCNKLWNASRFAMAILQRASGVSQRSDASIAQQDTSRLRERLSALSLADRWMLSRLATAVRSCEQSLKNYEFADYCQTLYQLLWWDFCDWYLEAIKPTVDKDAGQRAVLRAALDVIIRLLHPVAPFITEEVHAMLRGLGTPVLQTGSSSAVPGVHLSDSDLLCTASWPIMDAALIDENAEQQFESLRELINAIRNVRSEHQVLPKRKVTLHCSDATAKRLATSAPGLVENLAGVETIIPLVVASSTGPRIAFRVAGEEMFLSNLAEQLDAAAEKDRLSKQLDQLKKSEGALNGRLSNPGYVDKAPPKLVEESKAQLEKIRAEIAAVQSKLAAM